MACNELGVRGDGVSAELHKMLLYEQRGSSKHHDTRKPVNVEELKNNDEPVEEPEKNVKPVNCDELEKNEQPVKCDELEKNDKRVKVYELKNENWFDRGTGFCTTQLLVSGEARIAVRFEDDAQGMLLETMVSHDLGYQRQEGTLIVWTEPSGLDMAMSFEKSDECAQIWSFIVDVQQRIVATYPKVHDGLSLADSRKVPGMFATLVVSLPSAHWGGTVKVSYNGIRYPLQTLEHEYLAW
jgi:hypothetical protein